MINFSLSQKKELALNLGQALLSKNATVACVESCTGGGVAYAITEISGSSQWFKQSWVTYSNSAKNELIGVSAESLEQFGAVSEEVVVQMAELGAMRANADLCIAISGIAGPDGGSANKPVGLVWFAIGGSLQPETLVFNRRFSGERTLVREQAIVLGLEKLIQCASN